MTDFFVDSAAVGTNSGDSPTNAAWNLGSLSFGAASASVMWGDRIWVRRTYVHSVLPSVGRSGWNVNSAPLIEIIGWPSSGDQFYAQRPASAISAGWDGDAAQYTNIPYPVAVMSRAATSGIGPIPTGAVGVFMTNFALVSSVAISATDLGGGTAAFVGVRFGKFVLLNCNVVEADAQVDDLTMVVSYNTRPLIGNNAMIKKLTLAASCVLPLGVFGMPRYVGEINNLCNSVAGYINRSTETLNQGYIGVVRGTVTNNAAGWCGAAITNGDAYSCTPVEDWYGTGPRRIGGPNGWDVSVATSATAAYSGINSAGANATGLIVSSATIGTRGGADANDYNDLGGIVQQYLAVNCGMPYTIRLAFYATNANCLDGNRNAYIQARGPVSQMFRPSILDGSITVGSPARWAGSSVTAGSAYLMVASMTPTATGTLYLGARPPVSLNINSAFYYVAPFFEVTT